MNEPKNPNDFKYLEIGEIARKIQIGIEYCGKIYDYHNNKCTRIGEKYSCETCSVPREELKSICVAWKRVIHLAKLYHACQILGLILNKQGILPEWAVSQKKAEVILPISQLNLFTKGK